jgi:hypothetical protein
VLQRKFTIRENDWKEETVKVNMPNLQRSQEQIQKLNVSQR